MYKEKSLSWLMILIAGSSYLSDNNGGRRNGTCEQERAEENEDAEKGHLTVVAKVIQCHEP